MARVKQFADDLGISKNKAQSLINKGRSRKDGGSQILEKVMKKPIYAKKGKFKTAEYRVEMDSEEDLTPEMQTAEYRIEMDSGKDLTPEITDAKKKNKVKSKNKKAGGGLPDLTGDGKVTRADVLKGRGVPGFSRGGGMAIQGLGFKGVR
jgi:hypothetical protein